MSRRTTTRSKTERPSYAPPHQQRENPIRGVGPKSKQIHEPGRSNSQVPASTYLRKAGVLRLFPWTVTLPWMWHPFTAKPLTSTQPAKEHFSMPTCFSKLLVKHITSRTKHRWGGRERSHVLQKVGSTCNLAGAPTTLTVTLTPPSFMSWFARPANVPTFQQLGAEVPHFSQGGTMQQRCR